LRHFYIKDRHRFLFPVEKEDHWTLMAVGDGRLRYEIGNFRGEAGGGDTLLCPPNMAFHREAIAPLSCFFVKFEYDEADAGNAERIIDLLGKLFQYKYRTTEQDRLRNNFRHLIHLSFMKDKQSSMKWSAHFYNDIWTMFCMEVEALSQFENIVHDPLMKEAKDWIDQHACNEVKLKVIAKKLNIHPVQLSRRFQAVFDMSPSQYISSIRMEKAKSLLIQTDYTIEEIAEQCGYDNGYYFSRMFTKYTNVNPSKYRRTYSLENHL
jgi:AraC-like DNA-binding protein